MDTYAKKPASVCRAQLGATQIQYVRVVNVMRTGMQTSKKTIRRRVSGSVISHNRVSIFGGTFFPHTCHFQQSSSNT
jgi:hypothetical protein